LLLHIPEPKPVTNIWQFMGDTWLWSRAFTSCDDLADQCCNGWNTLFDQARKILSIATRDLAHGW
jgi:hypothetical protein